VIAFDRRLRSGLDATAVDELRERLGQLRDNVRTG
jgi:hypothetical protein